MQKLWFIFIIMILVPLLGCSGVSEDDDPDSDRGGFGDGLEEEEEDSSRNGGDTLGSGLDCEGDGYTLYLDACQGKRGGGRKRSSNDDDDTSTISSQSFFDEDEGTTGQPIDILFVLDTSASMGYWYNGFYFKKKFKSFLSTLGRVNYRMLFTNASYSLPESLFGKPAGKAMNIESKAGLLKKQYLDKHTGKEFFYTMTKEPNREHEGPGENGYGHSYINQFPPYMGGGEYPLRALQNSFALNKSLTRENGVFVAIIVTHTDEHPHKKSQEPTAESIKEEFQKVYGENKTLYILNLIILPGDRQCLTEQISHQFWLPESNEGQKIAKIAEEIGGGNFSICLPNYSVLARTIAHLSN